MRKTQVNVNGILAMVSDDKLTIGVRNYNSDMSIDTEQESEDSIAKSKVELSSYKEQEIVTKVLDRDDQLNMLALVIEQIGTHAGLDTVEFTLAKSKFAEIQTILAQTEVQDVDNNTEITA